MDSPRIFVSHSHNDDEFGVRLVAELRARLGDDAVWYDASGGLHGGDDWWNRIVAEITARNVFIPIWSPDYVTSKWCLDEVNIAWMLRHRVGTQIVPAMHRRCDLRPDWQLLQYIDFSAPRPFDDALADLLAALNIQGQQIPLRGPVVSTSITRIVASLAQDIHSAFGQEEWSLVLAKTALLAQEAPDALTPMILRERGLAAAALGEQRTALVAFDDALKLDPFDVLTLRGKGLALLEAGQDPEALDTLNRAYVLAPLEDVALRLTLLDDLCAGSRRAQNWTQALQRTDEALRLAPNDAEWLAKKLDLLTLAGRPDDAITAALGLVATQPETVSAWAARQLDRDMQSGDWSHALRVVEVALLARPDDAQLLRTKHNLLNKAASEERIGQNAASAGQTPGSSPAGDSAAPAAATAPSANRDAPERGTSGSGTGTIGDPGGAGVAGQPSSSYQRAPQPLYKTSKRKKFGWLAALLVAVIVLAGAITALDKISQAQSAADADQMATVQTEASQTSAAQVHQTAAAQVQATQTETAREHSPYSAAAPGYGCDTGGADWSVSDSTVSPTCSATSTHVKQSAAPVVGEVQFKWYDNAFPSKYTISVTVSNVDIPTCAGIETNRSSYAGYGFYACNGQWRVVRYSPADGSATLVSSGDLSFSDTDSKDLKVTVSGAERTFSIDGSVVHTAYDTTFLTTDWVSLALASPYAGSFARSATFSNFTFTPES